MKDRKIEARRVMEHYEIYVDDVFYTSCDVGELSEEMEEIENE